MKTSEFLAQLTRLGIRLSLEGGDLRIKSPKGALTPDVRRELAARKAELVELLGARPATKPPASLPPIERAPREGERAPRGGRLPLSFTQERIWFMDQLEPGITAYNMWVSCRLRGALDIDALERALTEVVRRHEVLRTTFSSEDGIPYQLVAEAPGPHETLRFELLGNLDGSDPRPTEEDLRALLTPRIDTPFDLEHGPLLRPALVRIADDEHVLFIAVHHTVFDGVSQGVFYRELMPLYEAFVKGEPSPLAELPVQYADYALWQRRLFEESGFGGQLDYWKDVLGGELPVLELPADHPRPAIQTHNGATAYHWVTQGTIEALNRAAKAKGATLFMVLLAAYKAFLHRYTGQTDLLVGTAMANRNRAEVEPLIGFFVNTLVMRTDMSGDPTFRELMVRVRDVCLGALENQDMPFQLLVDELQPERSLSHTPLFQTMFVLDEDPGDSRAMGSLELDGVDLAKHFARTDLVMSGYKGRDGFFFWVEFNTDLFERDTIERMLAHFVQLLEGIAKDPDLRLSELPLLSRRDVETVTETWNDTAADYPREPLFRQVEAQVDRTPDATAVVFPSLRDASRDVALTYRELDERANRLAHRLIELGARPGALVGLCLERSAEMIVAQQAIGKTGAAYVPLDPGFPAERLAYMAEDAGLELAVTTRALAGLLPSSLALCCLDEDSAALAAASPERPRVDVSESERMYVIYTSGSTGKPKGVELEHRSVSNFMASMAREPGFGPGDSILAVTTLSFDISVLETVLPLVTGGTVIVAPKEATIDGDRLRGLLERVRPTHMQATPATWRMLRLVGWKGDPELALLCGGEALPRELADELLPLGRGLWNLYGPTEATIWSTVWKVEPDRALSIGRPIANTRVYVLGPNREPLPIGVPGELWIAGDGLARGYLARPELTAERFVPDPFAKDTDGPGTQRMYRTGDLARWRADGTLECLGRTDNQVKLRGYRIELGEIEAVLAEHPAVRQCVALVREDRPGDQRLVAYFEAEGDAAPQIDELRALASAALPAYMVPQAFVAVDDFPLTPNLKVDRRALLQREAPSTEAVPAFVAPGSELERTVAGVFSEVLGRDRVGANDDFFALGGNSLLSTQAVARLRDRLGIELALRELFEAPTVAGLAARAALARPEQRVDIEPVPRDGRPLPLSLSQQRLWFLDQLEPGSSVYNVWMAWTLRGPLDRAVFERAVAEVLRRNEVLRTHFESTNGIPRQVIDPPGRIALAYEAGPDGIEPAVWRAAVRARLAELVREPFDLARGPLVRPVLCRVAADEHVFCLTGHHTVLDGWSLGRFREELGAMYAAFSEGAPSPLSEPTLQFADYATWERARPNDRERAAELDWWQSFLAGAPVLQLPADRKRPAHQSYRGAVASVVIPSALIEAVERVGASEGATPFMSILSAFDVLLARLSGQTDLSVGTAVAGRNQRQLEELMGYFAGTVVLRTNLAGAPTFRQLVRHVRERALQVYDHQDTPFEQVVERLAPERDVAYTPLFQAMFLLDDSAEASERMGPLELESFGLDGNVARTDLTCWGRRHSAGLTLAFEYATDLFERDTIERWLASFEVLLAGIAAGPDQRITELPLLGDAERRELLESWSGGPAVFPSEPIHAQFERHVDQRPKTHALLLPASQPAGRPGSGGERITFLELDRRANRLAQHLIASGVRPDGLVGVALERSADLIAAMLAVLKCGAAYVPLDPSLPAERLARAIEAAGLDLVIAHSVQSEALERAEVRVLALDREREAIEAQPPDRPQLAVHHDQRACLAHGAFSPRDAKGDPVAIELLHGGLSFALAAARSEPGLAPGERLLATSPIGLGSAALELLLPLTSGATLVLAPDSALASGERLRELFDTYCPEVALATPAAWRRLVAAGWKGDASTRIWCRGEPLPRALADELLTRGRELWNLYGPTEATMLSTRARVPAEPGPVSIGRPVSGARVVVVDDHDQPVPVGVPGELLIGGPGLARGYIAGFGSELGHRFVPDRFGPPGSTARLFRSGDRVRWRRNGTLEHLGRLDRRGDAEGRARELDEIEAVLSEDPAVVQAVALLQLAPGGERRLVACFERRGDEALDLVAARLASLAAGRLPASLVPTAFLGFDSWPRTERGEIDRAALAERAPTAGPSGFVAPRTSGEVAVAEVWTEVLGLERVGVHDDFFALGGNSLLTTLAVARLRARFGDDVPLRLLFDHPTLAGLAAQLGEPTNPAGGEALAIAPVPRDGSPLPLSFTQQRLWFLDQLEPGRSVYNVWVGWTLRGPLDVEALERAVAEIVRRHEVLRTHFAEVDGIPSQQVEPPDSVALEHLERGPGEESLDEDGWRALVRQRMTDRVQLPFQLSEGPLLRPTLARISDCEHAFCLTAHHTIFDGWSMGRFRHELGVLYDAFAAGRPSPLAEPTLQYADFAAWQRAFFAGEAYERQLAWWREQLTGGTVLELPTDRPRPAEQSYQGANATRQLPAGLMDAFDALGAREHATPFMTLLAAFAVLLHRHGGQADLSVGTVVAGRARRELEQLMGYFANTLVMRTDLSGDPSFRELVVRVREVCLGAYDHQDTPFEQLVAELEPTRDLSYTPLFQALFVLDDSREPDPVLGGPKDARVEIDDFAVENHVARTDVTFWARRHRGGLAATFEYATDLFDHDTVERMLAHLERLIAGAVAAPDAPISSLALLSDTERRELVEARNPVPRPFPREPLHRQVEAQADRTPDATALLLPTAQGAGDERVSYAELDARANRLAHHLIARGVRPHDLVGLCLERSTDMVVAQLAILKAGAAYVPLDPLFPPDRLTYMIADSGLGHVVSTRELAELLPGVEAQRVELDTEAEAIAARDDARPAVGVDADARMYVIYTSGSTGRPKGVELEHRSVSNFMASMAREPGLAAGETWLAVTTLSFDISVLEIFLPLVTGGTVAIATSEVAADGELLRAILERLGPQVMQATPATWRMLLLAGWQGDPGVLLPDEEGQPQGRREGGLRILCGGEALPRELADELLPCGRELWNLYGPTETTIWSTVWKVRPEGPVLIGRAIDNTRLYVLDAAGNPTPDGVPGHLWIGGDGLARGYLDRPELTAERFVPDPFAPAPVAGGPQPRMYHTGDLARWRRDGTLECLGRVDNQVKLRGFRIELGEIESVLADDPAVQQAVAVVREDTPGDQRLVAYVVLEREQGELDPAALRERCRGRLPAYMIPSGYVALEALPLTPNGKVDRRALLALERQASSGSGAFVAPSTETEEALAAIWRELLKLDRIGTLDNFFDLGGHSLLSVQVTARVRDRLGVRINPRDLMLQNLGQLAAVLEERAARDAALEDERHTPGRRLVDALTGIFRRRKE